MQKVLKFLDFVIYWSIILIPFTMAIAPAPMNVFMGYLIAAFLAKKIIKKERLLMKTPVDLPLMLLFILTFFSLFYSGYFKDTLRGGVLRLLQYVFVFYALCEEVKDKKHIWKIICSVIAALLLTCANEIWQISTGKDFMRGYDAILNINLLRATSSFNDANVLGTYLSAVSPLIFGLTLFYFTEKKRIVFAVLSVIALIAVLLTYSRPTFLAIYVVLVFFGIVRKSKPLIIFMVVFTLISPFLLPKTVKDWAKVVEYNPIRFMCNDDRIAAYINSTHMIKDHPVIGLGANTYMKSYKNYNISSYKGLRTIDTMYAHNNFLHMAAEIGLLGLGIFLWMLFALFKGCAKVYKGINDKFLSVVSISAIACLIAFLVNGLTESSLYSARVALIFWYLSGFALSLNRIKYAA